MAKKTQENGLWSWLKNAADEVPDRSKLHWCRVENAVKAGWPDLEGCWDRCTFVAELKSLARASDLKRMLTVEQAMFLHSRSIAGGSAWLMVQIGGEKRYLIPGVYAPRFTKPATEQDIEAHCPFPFETPIEALRIIASRFHKS